MYHLSEVDCIYGFNCTLFADDAAIYCSSVDVNLLVAKFNSFLVLLSNWLSSNKLSPNVGKTKLMFFSPQNQYVDYPNVYFNDVTLERVSSFKYLGLYIDSRLSYSVHCEYVVRKLSQVAGAIYSARRYLNRSSLLTIYFSLVYSTLTNSIIVYGSSTCLLYTSPSPRDKRQSRMPSSA